ncbi:hypothetical protein K0504_13665 [Neiella marina]|uniref:Uncharacterized protein n=1 Tax=Neiella holothuriorum TaxID=2870530 RepID=A0ABS7EID6_9GAMM|nr:hypothetical protein [Neiella holothuriorum]MBW8192085.1 hypothetical protein [Neiella holothuriorum]
MPQTVSRPSRFKTLLWCALVVALIWAIVGVSLLTQPSLTVIGQRWLNQTEQLNKTQSVNGSFYMMLGFDAPIDASNQAYGEQRWRSSTHEESDELIIAEPSNWRFGLPCYISMVECWPTVEQSMERIETIVSEQQAWLVRLEQLLAAEAPLGPLDQPLDDTPFPKAQLSSALELNLAAVMLRLSEGQPEQAFNQLNSHLTDLLRHIRTTNIRLYQSLLQRALRVELGWLVVLLQQRPELAVVVAEQMTVFAEHPQLMASLTPVLNRDFAIAAHVFEQIDTDGVSHSLDWQIELSPLTQQVTWQHQDTVNKLAESYHHALALMAGDYGLEPVVQAAKQWPNQADNWRDRNLIGSALLQEKYEQLTALVRAATKAEAFYSLAVHWIRAVGTGQPVEAQVSVIGQPVDVVKRPLEQRLCLSMPRLESLDDYCLRLYQPGNIAPQLDQLSVDEPAI